MHLATVLATCKHFPFLSLVRRARKKHESQAATREHGMNVLPTAPVAPKPQKQLPVALHGFGNPANNICECRTEALDLAEIFRETTQAWGPLKARSLSQARLCCILQRKMARSINNRTRRGRRILNRQSSIVTLSQPMPPIRKQFLDDLDHVRG